MPARSPSVDEARWRVRILDPQLFARKLTLLIIFSAAFVPLKYYELDTALTVYIVVLLLLHVYFVFVLIWRVRWRQLAAHRRSFALRVLAVAFFIFLLSVLETGVTFAEFLGFLAASLVIHTVLLLSLTLEVRPEPTAVATHAE